MEFLVDGPDDGLPILLAHGAGAAMDGPAMTAFAAAFGAAGLRVARFEFAYMAARRTGARRPPPRAETLTPEYRAAVDALGGRPLIGGKSLGGRVASLVADELHAAGRIAGLVCLGYPFHPPGKPDQLRTAHLAALATPTLIVQGTRDPFGSRDEVTSYALSDAIEVMFVEDGDHDLAPRRGVVGITVAEQRERIAAAVAAFAARVGSGARPA